MIIDDIKNCDKKYKIIYADPPWQFNTYSNKGKEKSADKHYDCMNLQDIKMLPINKISADDSILFMWVTMPLLDRVFEVIDSWGFTYKTCAFVWVKRCKVKNDWFMGMGYWTRSNAELCLLATRGSIKRVNKSISQICDARVMEHSRKPHEIRNRIVELVGDLPRIELFGREQIDGWDVWGNQVDMYTKPRGLF